MRQCNAPLLYIPSEITEVTLQVQYYVNVTTLLLAPKSNKTLVSFNFVKHWPIQNLFNDKFFQIYSIPFIKVCSM